VARDQPPHKISRSARPPLSSVPNLSAHSNVKPRCKNAAGDGLPCLAQADLLVLLRQSGATSNTIEGEFAADLAARLSELATFPNGKYDDQADSTSQALDWLKQHSMTAKYGLFEYYKREYDRIQAEELSGVEPPVTRGELLRR
jgi:hypothetical protein